MLLKNIDNFIILWYYIHISNGAKYKFYCLFLYIKLLVNIEKGQEGEYRMVKSRNILSVIALVSIILIVISLV